MFFWKSLGFCRAMDSKMLEMRNQTTRGFPCQAIPLKTDTRLHLGHFYSVYNQCLLLRCPVFALKLQGNAMAYSDGRQMCIEVWKLHLSSCKIKALMTGGKQQQIVTLMDRHFSKEIVYSNGCFLFGALWWPFYPGDVRIHPYFFFVIFSPTSRPVLFWHCQHTVDTFV